MILQGRSDGKVTQRGQAGFRLRRSCQSENNASMKWSWDLQRSARRGREDKDSDLFTFLFSMPIQRWPLTSRLASIPLITCHFSHVASEDPTSFLSPSLRIREGVMSGQVCLAGKIMGQTPDGMGEGRRKWGGRGAARGSGGLPWEFLAPILGLSQVVFREN